MKHREFLQYRRQRRIEPFKIFKPQHPAGNLPEHGRDAVLLVEEIGAEPRDIRNLVAEIHITGFLEHFDLVLRRDLVQHSLEFIVLQRRMVHALQLAVNPEHWVVARRQVKVGRLLLEHQIEKCIDFCHKLCIVFLVGS